MPYPLTTRNTFLCSLSYQVTHKVLRPHTGIHLTTVYTPDEDDNEGLIMISAYDVKQRKGKGLVLVPLPGSETWHPRQPHPPPPPLRYQPTNQPPNLNFCRSLLLPVPSKLTEVEGVSYIYSTRSPSFLLSPFVSGHLCTTNL